MTPRLARLGLEVIAHAINQLALPIISIITLTPAEYGRFSLTYLLQAFSSSLGISMVAEAWARSASNDDDWPGYSSASMMLALLSTLAVVSLGSLTAGLITGTIMALATGLTVYRSTARFYSSARRRMREVVGGDLASSLVYIATLPTILIVQDKLLAVSIIWLAGALGAVIFSRKLHRPSSALARSWLSQRWPHSKVLLADSALMEVGNTFSMYIAAILMGMAKFGLYRALTNLVIPSRLLLATIRPLISRRPIEWHLSLVTQTTLLLGSSVAGVGSYASLLILAHLDIIPGTTLQIAAGMFAPQVAILIATSTLGTYGDYVLRTYATGKPLMTVRVWQVAAYLILPLAGWFTNGLTGAAWGTVAASIIQLIALIAVINSTHHMSPGPS